MSSTKRKAAGVDLERRVRARAEPEEELEFASFSSANEESGSGEDDEEKSENSDSESQSGSDSESEEDISAPAASISFGALAKAQSTLSNPNSKTSSKSKSKKPLRDDGWSNKESEERKAGKKDHRDFSRTSKHAPQELSSKKAVSRRREVVPVAKRVVRDPRFEASSGMVDEEKVARNYDFLDSYRDDEMVELKKAIKVTKDEAVKERLKRELLSMESRKKAKVRKDNAKEVLERHRREEKELVKQGKQPFYLKKSEQRERVLKEQYEGLKGKGLERVIERRRKKVEGKEKRNMPWQRREV